MSNENVDRVFGLGVARAFGGAIIFSLPMLMTMEMWWLGFYMTYWKLALLLFITIPLLIGLSYYVGFRETFQLKEDALDALVAYAVGFIAAVPILYLFSVISPAMTAGEIIGKISLQAIPGSIGALMAQSQFGENKKQEEAQKENAGYAGEIFIMMVGALFLSFNLAPTEEMLLIAYKMNTWQLLGLVIFSILIMHSFVYAMEFKGHSTPPEGISFWSVFARYTVVGYAVSLLISFYILWTFGRTDGMDLYRNISITIVLGFPAAVGAAAARLII